MRAYGSEMKMRHQDILISGGGLAGLTAALAFGGAGFSVLCVDPAPPVTSVNRAGADIRTTALLQPARQLLERANLWHRLAGSAAPLQIMRIIDAGGESHEVRDIADFDAADISEAASTAGLTQTSVVNFGTWSGSRLVQPKSRTGKRA